jgi:hypothetical protein
VRRTTPLRSTLGAASRIATICRARDEDVLGAQFIDERLAVTAHDAFRVPTITTTVAAAAFALFQRGTISTTEAISSTCVRLRKNTQSAVFCVSDASDVKGERVIDSLNR